MNTPPYTDHQTYWHCKECGRERALIDNLCDDCTLKLYGCLFPWLKDIPAPDATPSAQHTDP